MGGEDGAESENSTRGVDGGGGEWEDGVSKKRHRVFLLINSFPLCSLLSHELSHRSPETSDSASDGQMSKRHSG